MSAADYRDRARAALSGRWGISVVVTLVAFLLGANAAGTEWLAAGSGWTFQRNGAFDGPEEAVVGVIGGADGPTQIFISNALLGVLAAVGIAAGVYALVVLLLGGAMDLGLKQYNIQLVNGAVQRPFGTLFGYFRYFGQALALRLLMSVFIFLWSLLLVIPGIVASYRYAMAPYLMSQNPNLGALEAISLSKQMMQGHKMDLFVLRLSFIGWDILASLTAGIGYLFLFPYRGAAEAAFFTDLAGREGLQGAFVPRADSPAGTLSEDWER